MKQTAVYEYWVDICLLQPRLSRFNYNLRIFNGIKLTTVRHHLGCGKVGIENASPRPQDFTVHSLVGWFNVKFDKEEKYSNSRTLLIVTCWYYDKNSCIKMQYLIICKLCLIKVTNKMTWREDWYFVAPCWTLRLHYIWKTCVYISKQKK